MSAKKETETKKAAPEEMPEAPYVPKPYAKKEPIRTRHVQSTGTTVEFYKVGDHMYEVECEHGTTQTGSRRYPMARAQSTPDEWCEKCAEAKAARAALKEAKKKAKAERKTKTKGKKEPPTSNPAKARKPAQPKAKKAEESDLDLADA